MAFLEREDEQFWQQWDHVARRNRFNAEAEPDAHMQWIVGALRATELSSLPPIEHSRGVPKRSTRRRLEGIADRLHVRRPDNLAARLLCLLLVNGAFVSSQLIAAEEAAPVLLVG